MPVPMMLKHSLKASDALLLAPMGQIVLMPARIHFNIGHGSISTFKFSPLSLP